MFAKMRFCCIEVLFHTFYYCWDEELIVRSIPRCSLSQTLGDNHKLFFSFYLRAKKGSYTKCFPILRHELKIRNCYNHNKSLPSLSASSSSLSSPDYRYIKSNYYNVRSRHQYRHHCERPLSTSLSYSSTTTTTTSTS